MRPEQLHAGALQELREAANYYELQRSNLGEHFLERFEQALRLLARYPDVGTPLRRGR